jgi:hypothetical protein
MNELEWKDFMWVEKVMDDNKYLDETFLILGKIAYWARRYPELYEPGDARNTIANKLAFLFKKLDEERSKFKE